MGTQQFIKRNIFRPYKNIIFLPASTELEYKVKFINTCDAYIHARKQGESFGIAVGEFSIKNKPILTYGKSEEKSHLKILGDKALVYEDSNDLKNIILNFRDIKNDHWDCYSELYNPYSIMKKFDSVFIK